MRRIFFVLFCISFFFIESKIRLFTFHCNRSDLLLLQAKTFNHFFEDDFELFVINDARDFSIKNKIKQICYDYGFKNIDFPQRLHGTLKKGIHAKDNPSARHCRLAQYALDFFGYDHNDTIGFIDGDMFPIRPFSIKNAVNIADIAGIIVYAKSYDWKKEYLKYPYFWLGICFINIHKIPNKRSLSFTNTSFNGMYFDSGGSTYFYLKQNPQVVFSAHHYSDLTATTLHAIQSGTNDFDEDEINFFEKVLDCYNDPSAMPKKWAPMQLCFDNIFLHSRHSSFTEGPLSQYHLAINTFLESCLIKRR